MNRREGDHSMIGRTHRQRLLLEERRFRFFDRLVRSRPHDPIEVELPDDDQLASVARRLEAAGDVEAAAVARAIARWTP